MRNGSDARRAPAAIAAGLAVITLLAGTSFGDDPSGPGNGRLARFFRMGSPSTPSTPANNPAAPTYPAAAAITTPYGQPALSTPDAGPSPAIPVKPKARTVKPATEADPIVTRIALGRTDGGSQFAMFMQVFADGTIIDGEGVHHVSPEALKPVVEAVSSGELAKLKGHCGGPAGDFIETVHVTVFERNLGRLRATAFSYAGSMQGCDHSVHHLHKALDELQTKISPIAPAASAPPVAAPVDAQTSPARLSMPAIPRPSTP